jgi:VIT1/CCC1 family predicted Fe2+/Mn2+ transporter
VDTDRDAPRQRRPAPHPEHHHRDVQGGSARAAVFGVSDGLVSNMGLILGVAGADPAPAVVRLAGLAGLISGAISMAAGEYNSMRVQSELLQRELAVEATELRRRPDLETAELAGIYEQRGLDPAQARQVAEAMMSDPDTALQAHAREELGIDPGQLGSPRGAAVSSFFAFSLGASVPLLPWFVAEGTVAIAASLILGVAAAVVVGAVVARSTGRPIGRGILRQVLFTVIPAAITFAIGNALGVGVS